MAATYGHLRNPGTGFRILTQMARTGSQLQMFIDYIGTMRGWGRGLRRAVAEWYTDKRPSRTLSTRRSSTGSGTTGPTGTCSGKPTPRQQARNLTTSSPGSPRGQCRPDDLTFALIHAYEQAKTADPTALAALIRAHNMTWEMMPSEQLDKPEVWEALAEHMPLTALVRNLATLTRVGAIAPMKSAWVCERLNAIGNARTEDFTRIHPIAVLSALLTYRAGKGARGSNTWTPVPQVVDALDQAFERSFTTAPQTNQRFYLGIDVSASMGSGEVAGVPGLTPRMAAAAMAMAIARREPNYYIAGFAGGDYGSRRVWFPVCASRRGRTTMAPLSITATDSLADADGQDPGPRLRRHRLRPPDAGRPGEEDPGGCVSLFSRTAKHGPALSTQPRPCGSTARRWAYRPSWWWSQWSPTSSASRTPRTPDAGCRGLRLGGAGADRRLR